MIGRLPRFDEPRVGPAERHRLDDRFSGAAVEAVEQDRPLGGRMQLMRPDEELHPGHPRQPHVGDHHRDLPAALTQQFQNRQAPLGGALRDDLVVGSESPIQRPRQRGNGVALVIDHEEHRPGRPRSSHLPVLSSTAAIRCTTPRGSRQPRISLERPADRVVGPALNGLCRSSRLGRRVGSRTEPTHVRGRCRLLG